MVEIIYPSVEEIQYNNTIAIEMFRRSKHDQAKTISVSYIQKAVDVTKAAAGDLYDKAALLLFELTRMHTFESENKRTAFLTTKKFPVMNGERFRIPDKERNVKIMIGIREIIILKRKLKSESNMAKSTHLEDNISEETRKKIAEEEFREIIKIAQGHKKTLRALAKH